jgi:predicted Rossmann fold nucleotide-binding protein DprA/Smf involved in DNA uptake
MQVQPTSRAANNHMEESGAKENHSTKILNAFRKCKSGTFERIAYYAQMKEAQVWKRLSELESAGKIRKTGKTAILSSGDKGVIWEIVETAPSEQPTQSTLF